MKEESWDLGKCVIITAVQRESIRKGKLEKKTHL